MRSTTASLLLAACGALGLPATAQAPEGQALALELRLGAVTTFGDAAKAGAEPFAQLRTTSAVRGGLRMLTWTRITAAPGAEFSLENAETFRAVDFELAAAYHPKTWNLDFLVSGGVQARAFEADSLNPPASRRVGLGVQVDSTKSTYLALSVGYDERQKEKWGAWLAAGAEIAPGISLIGTATVGRTSTTIRLAAAVGWR